MTRIHRHVTTGFPQSLIQITYDIEDGKRLIVKDFSIFGVNGEGIVSKKINEDCSHVISKAVYAAVVKIFREDKLILN